MVETLLDFMEDANERTKHGKSYERSLAFQEAAQYKTIYKALMHNITQKDYYSQVTPMVLRELLEIIRERDLLSEDEIKAIFTRGEQKAESRRRQVQKELDRTFGAAEDVRETFKAYRDPTADAVLNKMRKR